MAKRSGISAGHISRLENGTRTPTEPVAARLDEVFPERKGWFSEYQRDSQEWTPPGYRNWADYENAATQVRCWCPSVIHGLAQTPEYARSQLMSAPGVPAEIVTARLQARMERQKRLLDRGVPVWFLVDELALYRLIGTPEVMAGQMTHLLELPSRPDVSVQVVPAVGHPGANAELTVTDNAAYTEHMLSGYTYSDPETVVPMARMITTIQVESYRASESADIIGRTRDLWTTGESPLTALRRGDRA